MRIPLELWAYLILVHYLNPWPDLGGCPCPALSYQHGLPSMCCSHFLARIGKLFELLLYQNISWYVSWLWQYRLGSFQERDTKLERFLANNQLYSNKTTKFWKLELWGYVKKYQNLTFKLNFLCQKSSESFWSFLLKNIN